MLTHGQQRKSAEGNENVVREGAAAELLLNSECRGGWASEEGACLEILRAAERKVTKTTSQEVQVFLPEVYA